jgi:lipopolysaccharide transport system ATP-binding protein
MSTPVIKVENLTKRFVISHESKEKYTALRDVITQKAKRIMSGRFSDKDTVKEEFYALRDVNFEIEPGDRVGVVGRNGAGKSTLLKILSRITEPTQGRITIRGRVASLLEVGTGFHPELTGRENIYLNGAILGMSRSEIKRKFDEIVDFAEVEKFLDTPVKRYSSGMYVRLAFAVAAHMEPEILVIDEVLAVGDIQFQKKCLGKMQDVSKQEGRTVLFVSHNMSAMANLCNKGILLSQGELQFEGSINEVINTYVNKSGDTNGMIGRGTPGSKWWLNSVRMFQRESETAYININEPVSFKLDFGGSESRKISFELLVKDSEHNPVIYIPLGIGQNINFNCVSGRYSLNMDLILPHLALGAYYIDIYIVESFVTRIATLQNAFSFEVISSYITETGWNFERYMELGNIMAKINDYKLDRID